MAEASRFSNASIVRMILELEAETYGNPKGRDRGSRLRDDTVFEEAMQLAVLGSYHDIVHLLLDYNIDSNLPCNSNKAKTPLYIACAKGKTDMAKILHESSFYRRAERTGSFGVSCSITSNPINSTAYG
jgi:ankyrin repeat protein